MGVRSYSWILTLIVGLLWACAYFMVGPRLIFLVLSVSFLLAALGQWVRAHPREPRP